MKITNIQIELRSSIVQILPEIYQSRVEQTTAEIL